MSDERALAQQVADVVGPASAAAQALNELQRLEENGEAAYLFRTGSSWIVITHADFMEAIHA